MAFNIGGGVKAGVGAKAAAGGNVGKKAGGVNIGGGAKAGGGAGAKAGGGGVGNYGGVGIGGGARAGGGAGAKAGFGGVGIAGGANAGGGARAAVGGGLLGGGVNAGGKPGGMLNNFGYGNASPMGINRGAKGNMLQVSNTMAKGGLLAPAGNMFGPRTGSPFDVMNSYPGASAMVAGAAPGWDDIGMTMGQAELSPTGSPFGFDMANVQDNMGSPMFNGSFSPVGLLGNTKMFADRLPSSDYAATLASSQNPARSYAGIPSNRPAPMGAEMQQAIAGTVGGIPGAFASAEANRNRIGASLTTDYGTGAGASAAGALGMPDLSGLMAGNAYDMSRGQYSNQMAKGDFSPGVAIAGGAEALGGAPGMFMGNTGQPAPVQIAGDVTGGVAPAGYAGAEGQYPSINMTALGEGLIGQPTMAGVDMAYAEPQAEPEGGFNWRDYAPPIVENTVDSVVDGVTNIGLGDMFNLPPGADPPGLYSNRGMLGAGSNAGQTGLLAGNGHPQETAAQAPAGDPVIGGKPVSHWRTVPMKDIPKDVFKELKKAGHITGSKGNHKWATPATTQPPSTNPADWVRAADGTLIRVPTVFPQYTSTWANLPTGIFA